MRQKLTVSELVFLTILPALLLMLSACYQIATELLHLPPYLMMCISGLCAVTACLLWGASLCGRMLRPAALRSMLLLAALLVLECICYFLSGLPMPQPAAAVLQCVMLALLAPAPALFYRLCGDAHETEPRSDPLFYGMLLPSLLFSLLAVTNPLHRLMIRGDGFGAGLWLLLGWFAVCLLFAQIRLLLSARGFNARLVPLCLLAAAELAAAVCIAADIGPFSPMMVSKLAPLFLLGTVTLALAAELLPGGRVWPALLQCSTFPVQIMDREGAILYGADLALPITAAHRSTILSNRCPVILEKDMELSVSLIRGGYVLQQKDLRDLHALQDTLAAVRQELEQTRALLARESELEGKLQRLKKKNEFFAQQEAKIQEKTDRASMLLRCAAAPSPEPGFRRAVVTRANVLVAYVQQLGILLREAKETELLPVPELLTALEASAQAATAAGIRCRVYNVAQGTYPAEAVLALYDLFELVLEEVLAAGLAAMEVRLRNEQSGLRLVLAVQDADKSLLDRQTARIRALAGTAGGQAVITGDGGSVTVSAEFGVGGV